MLIRDLFRSDRPLFSIELFPPKTEKGVENLKRKLREIQPYHPDFISVTYGAAGGTRHTTSEITAYIHQELGMEAMPHLTCVSHSRAEIAGLLEHHRAIGVDNIMTLRGDPPQGESRFEPPPDGFRYAVELVREIKALDRFGIGVAGYPEGHPEAENYETDLRRQVEKVAAGADFVVSQFFLENRHFFRWRDDLRHAGVTVPIMAGILPAQGLEQITKFTAFCGASVPEALKTGLARYTDDPDAAAEAGLEYARGQIEELLAVGVDGIHVYALNRVKPIRAVHEMMASNGPRPVGASVAQATTYLKNDT